MLLTEQGQVVTGIDQSPKMIELARRKASARGLAVSFAVGDAAAPSADARTFDVAVSRHVLWALPEPEAALGRWLSLLAPGGRLVLIEGLWETGSGLACEQTLALLRRHGIEGHPELLSDARYWGRPINDERYVIVAMHPTS